MIAFALAVSLLYLGLPCLGNPQAFRQQETKLFLCPSYRYIDPGSRDGRNDPLWLLEKDDEWIPFRARGEPEQPVSSNEDSHQPKTFRCILFYLAAFSHFMLDLFTPSIPIYYVSPYYRVDGHLAVVTQGETAEAKSPPPRTAAESAMFHPLRNR